MDIIGSFAIVTTFFLIFFAFFLLTNKKGDKTSNRILSVFLFSNALFLINFLIFHFNILAISKFPHLNQIGNSLYLLLGPLLFLYTKSLCYKDYHFKKKDLIYFLPFLLLSSFVIVCYFSKLARIQGAPSSTTNALSRADRVIFFSILHILLLVFFIATLHVLHGYRKELKEYFSNIYRINLSWLLLILIAFIFMWLVDIVIVILSFITGIPGITIDILIVLSLSINLLFAMAVVYKGLKQPEIFIGIEERIKYKLSRLSREEMALYMEKLTEHMLDKKPYLEPSLTINELAEQLSIPARHLSQAITIL